MSRGNADAVGRSGRAQLKLVWSSEGDGGNDLVGPETMTLAGVAVKSLGNPAYPMAVGFHPLANSAESKDDCTRHLSPKVPKLHGSRPSEFFSAHIILAVHTLFDVGSVVLLHARWVPS